MNTACYKIEENDIPIYTFNIDISFPNTSTQFIIYFSPFTCILQFQYIKFSMLRFVNDIYVFNFLTLFCFRTLCCLF